MSLQRAILTIVLVTLFDVRRSKFRAEVIWMKRWVKIWFAARFQALCGRVVDAFSGRAHGGSRAILTLRNRESMQKDKLFLNPKTTENERTRIDKKKYCFWTQKCTKEMLLLNPKETCCWTKSKTRKMTKDKSFFEPERKTNKIAKTKNKWERCKKTKD